MRNEIYRMLPERLQDALVSCKGYALSKARYGVEFRQALSKFIERESWSEERVLDFQESQRIVALQRASQTLYYRDLFSKLGANWRDFIDPAAYAELPILRKSVLQNNIDLFRVRPPKSSDRLIMTSGTTGTSLTLPVSSNVEADQWAVWWRYRGWHGLHRGDLCALFASAPVLFSDSYKRPFRFNYADNQMRFSIFHITNESVHDYVAALEKYRPTWIHGNPTAISLLATYMIKEDRYLNYPVRLVTVGSENLLPWQRQAITKVFNVEPRQHYGLVEAVANFSECSHGRLHVDEDFSYVEFIQERESDSCAIVGTAFSNSAVSLLRYHTGDLANLSTSDKCECGRWGRIIDSIDGRLTDYVILPGGKRVASLAAPFHGTSGLAAAQLYQCVDGNLTVRYIPADGWDESCLNELEIQLRIRLGNEVAIGFKQVSEIAKTARGKTKLVVSDYASK